MDLGSYLKENNLTQYQFAELCRISQPLVSSYVTGRYVPTRKNMQKIITATAGKVSANDFYNNFEGKKDEGE